MPLSRSANCASLRKPPTRRNSRRGRFISFAGTNPGRSLVESLHSWLQDKAAKVPPKSLLGKAIAYALRHWKHFEVYIEDSRLQLVNNLAENAIRPFVHGRKNWLFSGNVDGTHASAALYSLIETAKANVLEFYW